MNLDILVAVIFSKQRKHAVAGQNVIKEGSIFSEKVREEGSLQLATFHEREMVERTLNRTMAIAGGLYEPSASFRDDDVLSLFA